jgi:hypothetical protein
MISLKWLYSLFFLFLLFPASAMGSECFQYEPAFTTLAGVVAQKTFSGGPNYESLSKGDKPETVWLLQLPRAICVKGDKDPLNEAENGVSSLQLVLSPEQIQKMNDLAGKNVSVEGTLFHSHTGHHHTKVLLTVSAVKSSLPQDVAAYSERMDACIHFSGEEPYDKKRAAELEREIKKACPGLTKQGQSLRLKYKDDAAILKELDALKLQYKAAFGSE